MDLDAEHRPLVRPVEPGMYECLVRAGIPVGGQQRPKILVHIP